MNSIVIVSDRSFDLAFGLVASLGQGWLVESAFDPAQELRQLEADGFEIDLDASELSCLHSEVLISAGAPMSGQFVLRRVLPESNSAKAIAAWLGNNADVGFVVSCDAQINTMRAHVRSIEESLGYVTAGHLLEDAYDCISELAAVSVWPRSPNADFDKNSMILFKDEQLLLRVQKLCDGLGFTRCDSWLEAVSAWRRASGCVAYFSNREGAI